MKSRTIIATALIASLASLSSFAQGRHDDRNDRNDRNQHGQGQHRAPERQAQRSNERHDAHSDGARGPQWRRGGRIPSEYRNRQYVVSDWRGHHLTAPPRGHQWVQVGGDYVLVAVTTGIIAQLLLNH
jgi:Ni/Co efflux regulator RcnB